MAIIIGDIHGCVEKVEAFLAYLPDEEHVALGDYLDSFFEPQQRQIEALQLLLESRAVLLWGNHDLHYLAQPPFICTGYQHYRDERLRGIIEANKRRFLAAYAVDGWLCSHAGVHVRLAREDDETTIAARLNKKMAEYIERPSEPRPQGIFAVGSGRGGERRNGGIFWFDFKRESGLATHVNQVFGHTECKAPAREDTYVTLDTTNNGQDVWLFDTSSNELIRLEMPPRKSPFMRLNTGAWND